MPPLRTTNDTGASGGDIIERIHGQSSSPITRLSIPVLYLVTLESMVVSPLPATRAQSHQDSYEPYVGRGLLAISSIGITSPCLSDKHVFLIAKHFLTSVDISNVKPELEWNCCPGYPEPPRAEITALK